MSAVKKQFKKLMGGGSTSQPAPQQPPVQQQQQGIPASAQAYYDALQAAQQQQQQQQQLQQQQLQMQQQQQMQQQMHQKLQPLHPQLRQQPLQPPSIPQRVPLPGSAPQPVTSQYPPQTPYVYKSPIPPQNYSARAEDDFIFEEGVLGGGQFGVVQGAVSKQTGAQVAIKMIQWRALLDAEMTRPENLKAEMALLKTLRNPGIICLEHIYSSPDLLYLVMERAFGGDFLDRILKSPMGHLPERMAKFYMWQTLLALVYLHENNVAHRDLKPENVLLLERDEPFTQTKLCDFGFARIVGEDSFMKSLVGTKAYVAPEVLTANFTYGYKLKVDLWSVGVVAYVALSGTFPFNENEPITPRSLLPQNLFPEATWGHVSDEGKNWIYRCFMIHPDQRFSAVEALQDPWLQDAQLKSDLLMTEIRLNQGPIFQVYKYMRI